MTKRWWLAVALLAACGSKAAAESGVDAAADAAPGADAAGDALDTGDASADVVVALSPAAQMCADIGAKIAATAKTCCTTLAAGDWAGIQTDDCMKAGFGGIDDASAAGTVKLDATRGKACEDALAAAAKACDYAGLQAARHLCLLAWLDTSKVGDDCTAAAPVACGGFVGRCSPVTVDLYACKTAGTTGDKCGATQPCGVDLECLNGTLTRAMTCGKPGSTCNLSDTCAQGFQCDAGACKPWVGGGTEGALCKADTDCAIRFVCGAGACVESLCFASM